MGIIILKKDPWPRRRFPPAAFFFFVLGSAYFLSNWAARAWSRKLGPERDHNYKTTK